MVFINPKSLPLAASLFISATSAADVALYGQCGGTGFTGSTTCVSGAVCQSQNAFYYQCVAGTGTATSAAEVISSTTIAPVTTALAVSSLAPVVSSTALQVSSATTKKKCDSSTFATSVAKQSISVASSSVVVQASSAAQAVSSQISSAKSVVASSVQSSAAIARSSSTSSVPLITTTFAALPTAIVSTSSALIKSTQAAIVASSSSSAAVASIASSSASSGTKYLMVFGDSYTSDGFYGGAPLPSASNPLGVALPGTTTDGGLGWLGVVATELNNSLVLGYDYAEYGATTDNTLVKGATHDLIAQVT
ncbi:hypothetical protein BPOR_0236g00090 [Botrytis porri]|nr:hypothetical protein BPOR_0236g00090 [Botrytis porri]